MPHNTTVSHISPLLSYIPRSAWYEADSSDPDLDNYSNHSYHYSNSAASVAFSWWGTGIWVFGGRRSWSGEYVVSVDNQEAQTFPAYSSGNPDEFQQLLFGDSNLANAPHQILITNPGANPDTQSTLDIDYIIFESAYDVGDKIDHNDTFTCIWNPKANGVWEVDEASHTTENDLGSMELNFTGSGITLYGYLGQDSAPLSVSIDGWASTPVAPNTNIAPLVSDVHVLYTKSGLQEGSHTLRVQNNPLPNNRSGSRMSIAYSQVLSSIVSGDNGSDSSSNGETDNKHRTVVLAASFSVLGAFLLSILIWRLIVLYRRRKQAHKEMVAPRPFYARTNPSSPPQSPRLRLRPGRQRHWRRDDDDIEAQTAILTHTASRTPGTRRTRRSIHRRPPSDIEFARSWSSSRFEYEGDADSHGHRHGHSRSYDDLGYPRTATYPHTDEAVWNSELTLLRHARNTSAASSASSHTIRDSLSVHATAPPSPAVPVFDRDHPPPPLPLTLPLRVNRRRRQQQQRRPGSIEKPPLDVEEQLAIFASVSNARRAGAGAEARTDTALQLVGSPATSLPSLRPSTTAGTRSGAPRPLPPPPVPPLPSHPREPTRTSPSQDTFDPWDVGMGQPPPYRLLDLH